MTALRFAVRPLAVGAAAALMLLFLAFGPASTAHAQDPGQLLPEPEGGEELLPLPEGELPPLEGLTLEELQRLLDQLLGEQTTEPPPAEPASAPAPAAAPAPNPAPAPGGGQVTQRPVGGVAAGAGGASDQGATTWPLLALATVSLAGTAAALRPRPVRA